MKQFIVLLAVLPLMLIFCVQFSLDQVNNAKISTLNDIVYSAKEQAKQDGCFTEETQEKMIADIVEKLGIDESDIQVELDTAPVARLAGFGNFDENDGLIHYRIEVNLGKAMVGASLLDVKSADNVYRYVIDSYTASEKLL